MKTIIAAIVLAATAACPFAGHAGSAPATAVPATPPSSTTAKATEAATEAASTPTDPGCRDFRRRPVRILAVKSLGDAGRAEFIGGGPVIKFDPDLMVGLPPPLREFFMLHECAHHALGHLFAPTLQSEKEADCWAMKEGVRRRHFQVADVPTWSPWFQASRGTMMHLPGPERLAFLANCVDAP
jgi:hypothetical protein